MRLSANSQAQLFWKHYMLTFNVKAGGWQGSPMEEPLMMVAMRQKLLGVPMKYSVARSRRQVSRSGTTGRQRPHGRKVRCRRIFH
jgi:hypothetical protein